jgi:hypothetical protein
MSIAPANHFYLLGLTYYIFWITDFHHHFGRSGGGNKTKTKKTSLSTPHFILQGLLPPLCGGLGQFKVV